MDKPLENISRLPAHATPKDFFLWAGAMVTLYVSIFSFLGLVFNYINYAFPNPLQPFTADPYQSGISYQMASLIVMFPLFLVVMHFIHRDIKRDATRREVWVRRWALMLTLFLAGLTAAIDLIVLLNTFLGGQDLTAPFLIKVALVFLTAAGVFMHFIADFWGNWERYPGRARRVAYGSGLLVVLTIVAGFAIVGTPMQARQALLDSQKVSDLQNIQSQIVYYWQQKGTLPPSLASLDDSISNYTVPIDAQTGKSYTYNTQGAHSFQLCATFNRDSNGQPQLAYYGVNAPMPVGRPYSGNGLDGNWQHGSGQTCFLRTIDPELYPVNTATKTAQ